MPLPHVNGTTANSILNTLRKNQNSALPAVAAGFTAGTVAGAVTTDPNIYRSYILNDLNSQNVQWNLSITRANESDEDMREIYEIDREAFADYDPYDSYEDFKGFVTRENMSTYIVRDNDGNVVGYYQLEPIKDGDLYIDSMGLKSDYRNTRKGYLAINECWDKINEYAQQNDVKSLSLHVNADNRALVRMYQRLGFTITETLNNYYGNGANAHFMIKPLDTEAEETPAADEAEAVQEEVTVPTGVQEETSLPESEQAEEIQETEEERELRLAQEAIDVRVKEAIEEVSQINSRCKKDRIEYLVTQCVYKTPDGTPKFSEGLLEILKVLAECSFKEKESIYGNRIVEDGTLEKFLEFDKYGNPNARTDLIPYIRKYTEQGSRTVDIYENFRSHYKYNSDGAKSISTESLDALEDVKKTIKLFQPTAYYRDDEICECYVLRNKDNSSYINERALSAFKRAIMDNFDPDDATAIVKSCIFKDTEGQEYFDDNFYKKLVRLFGKDSWKERHDNNIDLYSLYQFKRIKEEGVPIRTYIDLVGRINQDEDISYMLAKFKEKKDVGREFSYGDLSSSDIGLINRCALVKAIASERERKIDCFEAYPYDSKKSRMIPYTDMKALEFIQEHCKDKDNFKFKSIYYLANIVTACKNQTDANKNYEFSEELFEKAMKLKEAGMSEEQISKLIESCKLNIKGERISYTENKFVPCIYKKFSDEIFDAIYDSYVNRGDGKPFYTCPATIENSIEIINGKERFNKEIYDMLKYHYDPQRYSYDVGWDAFFETKPNGDRIMNKYLLQKALDLGVSLNDCCDVEKDEKDNKIFIPNELKMDAAKALKSRGEIPYTRYEHDAPNDSTPYDCLMYVCKEDFGYPIERFNYQAFEKVQELLDRGIDGRDVQEIIYNSKQAYQDKYRVFNPTMCDLAMQLIDEGMEARSAAYVANNSVNGSIINEDALSKMKEFYAIGCKIPHIAFNICKSDPLAYERQKESLQKGFSGKLIKECFDEGEFKDRLYRQALMLQDKGYDTHTIEEIMKLLHFKKDIELEDGTKPNETYFNQEVYNHISELENLGIDKKNIYDVLKSCTYHDQNYFSEEAYSKIPKLKAKGFDDKGIAMFTSIMLKASSKKGKIDQEKFDELIWLTARHNDLKDDTHDDGYIVDKIFSNSDNIKTCWSLFGQDVLNFQMSAKIDNYINFVNQCSKIQKKSPEFIKDLQTRLDELPSPDLRVRRLRIIGSLVDKVDEDALKILTRLIRNPKMTQEQMDLANSILAVKNDNEEISQDDFYASCVKKFVEEINAPAKTKKIVEDYLMKERLDNQIDWPKPIEEQVAQMEKFAQQMLTNPKIPLDKKIKYIDEYKAKIADMQANPDKYTTPKIFPKPMANLAKVIEAYVNIPNDDARFENSIKETMYAKFGIETTPELLAAISYDAKYFDKLLSAQPETVTNFKHLIELKKSNPSLPLTDLRMTLPEVGTPIYEAFDRIGLIEQIKANLDTKRQFEEQNLRFDKWNKFDPNLNGEVFTVKADPETEYGNIRFNMVNVFQDELWNKMNPKETEKLMDHLASYGYTIFNNHIYKGGQEIQNNELLHFADTVVKYIDENSYFKNHTDTNGKTVSAEEIDGITGFSDHIRGHQKRIKEIRNGKTVSDIHFRLSDDDNIGRNIFFGNHVACCNSIESTYAGYSAPQHLKNAYNRGVELVDKYGNSYGNSLCQFEMIDGKLTFVIDSFEANGKLASNPLVTENLLKFARQVCIEMGCPDAKIAVGPQFNNMNTDSLQKTQNHSIKVIGTVSERTYCDTVGGKVKDEINQVVEGKSLYFPKYQI